MNADTHSVKPEIVFALGRGYEYLWIGERSTDRPALVLLHQGLGSAAMWGRFPARLHQLSGYPVFAFSRKGHGNSDPETVRRGLDYMYREATEDLPAVLHAIGVGPFWLIGHSDGGSIALMYASNSNARSAQLQGLVVMAAHVFNEPACLAGVAASTTAYGQSGLRESLKKFHGRRVDAVFKAWRDMWVDPAFANWSMQSCLSLVLCPVLVVQGRNDTYGTVRQVEVIESCVSGPVETVLFDDCGHSPHRERADACEESILAFLTRWS